MKKFYKHIVASIVLMLLFTGLFTNCMLNNIKETDSILHKEYQHLSLVHGAIAWEAGVIRRLYDFGQIFPQYGQDKKGRNIIENYENADETHKTIRLIHALFYRVPGSTAETDFGATTQLAKTPIEVVTLLAQIIVQCEELQQQQGQFLDALNYMKGLIATFKQEDLDMLGKKVTRENLEQKIRKVQEKPWNKQDAEAFVSMCKLFEKNLAKELDEQNLDKLAMYRQTAEKFFKAIAQVTQNLKALFKPEVFKKRENVESIIFEALDECNPQNLDELYPPQTVEMILLAFVYKKYSYDRNILKAFYDALNTQFVSKILVRELDEQWVKDSFQAVTQNEALKTIEDIFTAQDLMQNINQNFAALVYNAFQIRAFPAPVGYAEVMYEYEKGKKTVAFSDCMDNTMRNFINLYAYDTQQNKFTLEKLLTAIGVAAVHPTLADFLKEFGEVNKATSIEAHNAWLTVISNIPYVAYNQMVDSVTGQSTVALETGKGYIATENERSDELLSWLKNAGYQVLEKNQYGYELQPSVKNIIIVLDHLLALNLFSNAGGLAKVCIRSDFIKEYFPKLCVALKATGFLTTQKDSQEEEPDKDFDVLDYTVSKIYTLVELEEITAKFATSSGHGELKLITTEESSSFELLFQKIHTYSGQPSLSLLATNLLCKQTINFDQLNNNPEYLYVNLFAAPLENTDLLESIIDKVFYTAKDNTSLKIKIHIKNLLLRLAENQPDAIQKLHMKLRALTEFVESLSDGDMKNGNTDIMRAFKDTTEAALKGVVDQDPIARVSALSLFATLVEKNQAFAEATEAAKKGMMDPYIDVRKFALKLFGNLVAEDQAFAEAAQAAAKGVFDKDIHVFSPADDLLNALIEKNQGLEEATQVAIKGVTGVGISLGTRARSIRLFEQLMLKRPDKTREVIQKILGDPNIQLMDSMKSGLVQLLEQ